MEDHIVTERLVLRRARVSDLADMHRVLSEPKAMRYWSTPPHTDIAQTREWLANMMADAPGLREDFVVELDDRVIGKAGCYRLPEVGYILHPDHWGQGLATEALRAVTAYIFAHHPAIDAITADVDPRNPASIGLLEKVGFTITGRAERTCLIGDEWCDSIYLALRRPALPHPDHHIGATADQSSLSCIPRNVHHRRFEQPNRGQR